MKWKIPPVLFSDSLHIFSLTGLTIAQPLFDLLSAQAEFFAARRSGPIDIFLFGVSLPLVLPGLLVLFRYVIDRFSETLGRLYHGAVMTVLFALLLLLVLKRLSPLPSYALAALTPLLALAVTAAYLRSQYFHRVLTVLVPSTPLLLFLFLFDADIKHYAFPSDQILTSEGKTIARVPVVMIVFDELPVGALMTVDGKNDGVNFPNFSRLSEDSVWFRNATTVAR